MTLVRSNGRAATSRSSAPSPCAPDQFCLASCSLCVRVWGVGCGECVLCVSVCVMCVCVCVLCMCVRMCSNPAKKHLQKQRLRTHSHCNINTYVWHTHTFIRFSHIYTYIDEGVYVSTPAFQTCEEASLEEEASQPSAPPLAPDPGWLCVSVWCVFKYCV